MHNPFRTARRRAVLIASGTAVLLAVGGGATAAMAATADGSPTPSATPAACGVHLRAELRGAMPAQLKADLKKLRAEPKGAARAAERKEIRQKALAGGYGARAEQVARVVGGGKAARQALAAELPASLRADLKTLRGEPKGAARQAEAKSIEQKALAGDYGTTIQNNVKTVQARFQAKCEAKQG
ncbi:hypothetical protein [Amnibacterium kyonggiense]|uniref:Uncharacterized protein n=1 Tax=Amnibacterium kyonggiense TaxID=595671 RepID=A0A4R7FSS2_9MICO|nr:hypothetical protein [Amnibacterium kyonggiense]TDS80922.1 hypothetical protein CLV52_1494 [Amnibacterium kyonggiense]